ncbi:MAG TPA: hypothetical protein VFS00_20690, partial [Polyangiaceae bacterium]|nr:hypothetical protein [Polyangiaceae bacterium]
MRFPSRCVGLCATAALLLNSGCNLLFGFDESSLPPQDASGAGGGGGAGGQGPGSGGAAGAAGTTGGAGSAGSAGNALCVASEGLTRTPNQACADSQLVCKQTFSFPHEPGIREVQLQGALIPDTSWATGAYMKNDGVNWTAEVELKPGTKLPYRYYVLRDGDAFNFGTYVDQPELTVSCATPVCARRRDPWASEAKRARPAPPVPADPVAGQPPPPFDW